ncbi:MAG: tetratricopeptide repeat protein, partial [bacterium]|nr:tetratricopeptide repeat protein [bacterium]
LVFVNSNQFDVAKSTFEGIVARKNHPWTDLNASIIRNESLLKLGYLHYQRGEYDRALGYFSQISRGFENYDEGLLGQAWANLKKGKYDVAVNKVDVLSNNYLMSNYTYEALVLSAHCKRAQNQTQQALNDLRYVANSKMVLNKVHEYNQERRRVLKQLDELEALEEQVLEHQNRELYPKIVKTRELINTGLASFRFRGAVSSRIMEEYNSERKLLIRQVEEFDRIIQFAENEGDTKLLNDAVKQRDRMITVLKQYQLNKPLTKISYFMDYPVATREGGVV